MVRRSCQDSRGCFPARDKQIECFFRDPIVAFFFLWEGFATQDELEYVGLIWGECVLRAIFRHGGILVFENRGAGLAVYFLEGIRRLAISGLGIWAVVMNKELDVGVVCVPCGKTLLWPI